MWMCVCAYCARFKLTQRVQEKAYMWMMARLYHTLTLTLTQLALNFSKISNVGWELYSQI